MQQAQALQHLQQVICFSLEEISLWGARKKLRVEDLKLASGDELPPKDLASLGSKKIFNPKILAKFEALKKQAHTACSRVGVRFMGGYAVPETAADALAIELDAIGVKFEIEKTNFINTYQTELDAWIAKHPGWEQVIRASSISVAEVQGRIRYGWVPARITTPDEKNPESRLNQKMVKEAGGLAGSLFREVSEMGGKVGDSLLGKMRVNRRVLSSIRKIHGKLKGLSFLDKRVNPLITLIDETLDQMPGDAPIEGLALTALNGLVMTLSDIDRMKEYGQAVLDGNPVKMSFGVVTPQKPVEVQMPAVNEQAGLPNLFDDAVDLGSLPETPKVLEVSEIAADAAAEIPEIESDRQSNTVTVEVASIEEPVVIQPMVRVVEVVREQVVMPVNPAIVPPIARPSPMRRVTF